MTKDGKENKYEFIILEEDQAERIMSGDVTAAWEFIADNLKFLNGWARKALRRYTNVIPQNEYETDDLINQVYADVLDYDFTNFETIIRSIFKSYIGVAHGGYAVRVYVKERRDTDNAVSLDAPLNVTGRSGGTEEVGTFADILPSREPTPAEALEEKEHVREIAPHFYYEIGRVLCREELVEAEGGATIGEMLAYRRGGITPFQDVIEEIFFGYTFEEVRAYAKRTA